MHHPKSHTSALNNYNVPPAVTLCNGASSIQIFEIDGYHSIMLSYSDESLE